MSYQIRLTNGSLLVEIQPETIDTTTTSLALWGTGYTYYGQALDTNFVHLAENFANINAPTAPLTGQMWFASTTGLINLWNGTIWAPLATQTWVSANYLTLTQYEAEKVTIDLTPYATITYVTGYIQSLGYATVAYVTAQGFATQSWVQAQGYLTSVSASTITVTGDVTGTGTTNLDLTLTPTGVTPSTYTKVTVDGSGRVLAGASITSQDVINALGYVPGTGNGTSSTTTITEPSSPITSYSFGTLGSTAGSTLPMLEQSWLDSNVGALNFFATRFAAGTTWTTASTRLQQVTDVTQQGFLEFNPPASAGGIALGTGTTYSIVAGASLISLLADTRITTPTGLSTLTFASSASSNTGTISFNPSAAEITLGIGTVPMTIGSDGSAVVSTLYVKNLDPAAGGTGLSNPIVGELDINVGGVGRIFITGTNVTTSKGAVASGQNDTIIYFGPQSSTNPNGIYNLYLDGAGLLSLNSGEFAGAASAQAFEVNIAGGGAKFNGSVTAAGQVFSTVNSYAVASGWVKNAAGTIIGSTGSSFIMLGPDDSVEAGMSYNGQGALVLSAAVSATAGFTKSLVLDSSGNVTIPGNFTAAATIVGNELILSNGGANNCGLVMPGTNEMVSLVGGGIRDQWDADGERSIFFGTYVGTTTGTYYEFRYQADRNVCLYSITPGVTGAAIWSTLTSTSDARLKQAVRPLDDGKAIIAALRPVHFEYLPDRGLPEGEHIGFLAQDVQALLPQAVYTAPASENTDESLILHKQEIVPHLVRALQQTMDEVKVLQQRLSDLEARLDKKPQ